MLEKMLEIMLDKMFFKASLQAMFYMFQKITFKIVVKKVK